MNVFGIANLFLFLVVFLVIAFIIRKVIHLPEKNLKLKTTYSIFIGYFLLFLLAIPVSFIITAEKSISEQPVEVSEGIETHRKEIATLIEDGDIDTILSEYKSQQKVYDLAAETLTWSSMITEYPYFNVYIEETGKLDSEIEVIYLYPKVIIDDMDMSAYQPDVSLTYSEDHLELYSSGEKQVTARTFTHEFVITQFSDDKKNSLFSSGHFSSESPHILWIRVPVGTNVKSEEKGSPFDYQRETVESD